MLIELLFSVMFDIVEKRFLQTFDKLLVLHLVQMCGYTLVCHKCLVHSLEPRLHS